MASNTLTAAALPVFGAITKFVMDGVWSWRAFIIAVGGGLAGIGIAYLMIETIPYLHGMSDLGKMSFAYVCGYLSSPLLQRINRMSFKGKIAGIEIDSPGEKDK